MKEIVFTGLQKLTLLDFPGKVACTLFTKGCNMRCPFCHNASLVVRANEQTPYDNAELLEFLKKRFGLLDGVAITGGEPTLWPGLYSPTPFIKLLSEVQYNDPHLKLLVAFKSAQLIAVLLISPPTILVSINCSPPLSIVPVRIVP